MNKTIGADQPLVQNRELRRRTGEKIVLRPRASTNYQYRRRVRNRKYHSHEMTSRGRRNGILRQVEKIFRQVQFVRRRSRRGERYIRRWLLCASFIRDMERLRTAERHRLDAVEHQNSHNSFRHWQLCSNSSPRREIVFFSQVIIIYVVIAIFLVNLSLDRGDSNLWSTLLSDCLGYLLSSPTI